jgi:hypothetical protein
VQAARLDEALGALNEEQSHAVAHINSGWRGPQHTVRISLVDGPPGTGKTWVAACASAEWLRHNRGQVVILAPTHRAAERSRATCLRVGLEGEEVLQLKWGPTGETESGALTFENVETLPPHQKRKVQGAGVLVTTWQGARRALDVVRRPLIILDEVSQIPYSGWLALVRRAYETDPRGFALIGDPHQLPVVSTQEVLATNAALGILRRHPECRSIKLTKQYRMNRTICAVVNEMRRIGFGGDPLLSGSVAVEQQDLRTKAGRYTPTGKSIDAVLDPAAHVVIVDTSPLTSQRGLRAEAVGGSWVHHGEARLAATLSNAIRSAYGLEPTALSPYAAQANAMQTLGLKGSMSVFRAQGHEWDCVILSLARSEIAGRTILDEMYQHNYVGLSRARCKLIVLMNATCFRPLRLLGGLLTRIGNLDGARVVEADPSWIDHD